MFLRCTTRKKNGKVHHYWSLVENRRVADGRVAQRPVLYLGEINDAQARTWRSAIEAFQEGSPRPHKLALFPDDGPAATPIDDAAIVRLRFAALSLHRPRQWGGCWLALQLWRDLGLDRFWADRLPASRKGTRWDWVLTVLTYYRLLAPGQRVAAAPGVVRSERLARSAAGGLQLGRESPAL